MRNFRFFLAVYLTFPFAIPVQAQHIASKCLLRPAVIAPPAAGEAKLDYPNGCEKMGVGFADGATLPDPPREIKVALVNLSETKLTIGNEVTATVKLENAGRGPITIPWSTEFQTTLDGQDPDNRRWEIGQFRVALRNAKSQYDELIDTSLPLYGSEFVPGSRLAIKPGEWITAQISFRVAVVHPEFEKVEEGSAELTLEWFQTVRTYVVKGCGVTRGFFPYDSFYQHKSRVVVQRVEIVGP